MTQTTKQLIQARYAEVEGEIAAIEAKSAPLRAKRNELQAKIAPVEAEMRALHEQIKAVEQPTLSALKMEQIALAKALGSKGIKAESGAVSAKVGE